MKELYYTPEIEDFHVGFEYEQFSNINNWFKQTFGDSNGKYCNELSECYLNLSYDKIRVPYLTQEQIKAEGWNHTGGKLMSSALQHYNRKKSDPTIFYSTGSKTLSIEDSNGNILINDVECKDINTFRKIIKLLKL